MKKLLAVFSLCFTFILSIGLLTEFGYIPILAGFGLLSLSFGLSILAMVAAVKFGDK